MVVPQTPLLATGATTIIVEHPPYNQTTAIVASAVSACLCGIHGVHSCYLDQPGKGIIQCLTFGGCWIWTIIDWVNMEHLVHEANARKGYVSHSTATATVIPGQQIIKIEEHHH